MGRYSYVQLTLDQRRLVLRYRSLYRFYKARAPLGLELDHIYIGLAARIFRHDRPEWLECKRPNDFNYPKHRVQAYLNELARAIKTYLRWLEYFWEPDQLPDVHDEDYDVEMPDGEEGDIEEMFGTWILFVGDQGTRSPELYDAVMFPNTKGKNFHHQVARWMVEERIGNDFPESSVENSSEYSSESEADGSDMVWENDSESQLSVEVTKIEREIQREELEVLRILGVPEA